MIAAYMVTLAVLIPLSGWMAARWGARPVFLAAMRSSPRLAGMRGRYQPPELVVLRVPRASAAR